MSKFKGQIALLIAAIIWGSSFIFQKMGMDFMSPFTFGFYRFFLGSLALLPVIWIYSKFNKRKPIEERTEITSWTDKTLIIGSLFAVSEDSLPLHFSKSVSYIQLQEKQGSLQVWILS
ncbi:MAG: DMT family transporter [Clostridia bacterium]